MRTVRTPGVRTVRYDPGYMRTVGASPGVI